MKRIAAVATAVALAASVVVGVGGWDRLGGGPAYAMVPPDVPTTSPSPSPSPTPTRHHRTCPTTSRPFVPKKISMRGITKKARIVAPPRVHGVPGSPPLTSAGKQQFAWDRKWRIRPGYTHGNVLLNAHVWPDGSAVGNRMLAKLHRGDRIVVFGKHRKHAAARKLCYRVTKQIQVYPRQALRRYYKWTGRPKLAIVVCSGRRLGPGVWEKRTIWFARPSR